MKIYLLLLTIAFGLMACEPQQQVWKPYASNERKATTQKIDCGKEKTIYTNNSTNVQLVSVEIKNKCEFSSWLWTLNESGGLIQQRSILGGDTLADDIGLNPNDSIYLICTLVDQAKEGCCDAVISAIANR